MYRSGVIRLLAVLITLIVNNSQAHAAQISIGSCSSRLSPLLFSRDPLNRLKNFLRRPDVRPKNAISAILSHLAQEVEGNGLRKHKIWMELVSYYSHGRSTYGIASPCLRTAQSDVVCWGEVRGHILIFESTGLIFKSFNPERPNPQAGADGFYAINWKDRTLKEVE